MVNNFLRSNWCINVGTDKFEGGVKQIFFNIFYQILKKTKVVGQGSDLSVEFSKLILKDFPKSPD